MKNSVFRNHVALMLMALLTAQLACSFGAQSQSNTQPADNGIQATQPPVAATKGERGTQDEAKALLQLAIDHYNQVGADQAHKDFGSGQAPWIDRDLYVVCMGADHIESVNGGFPQYNGASADAVTTLDGIPVGQASWDAATSGEVGSVDFMWLNPINNQTEPKRLFVEKVGNEVCGVGAYNP